MNARERLIELLNFVKCKAESCSAVDGGRCVDLDKLDRCQIEAIADHLLANGVVVVDTNIVSPKNLPLISQCLGRPIDEIIELVNAKDEGRIVVLPCKVGDTVYFHDDYVWTCDCRECDHFCPGYCGDPNECLKTNSSRKSPECIGIKEKTVAKENLLQYLYWEDFGKTVFLTREEAEKALAERKKDNG